MTLDPDPLYVEPCPFCEAEDRLEPRRSLVMPLVLLAGVVGLGLVLWWRFA